MKKLLKKLFYRKPKYDAEEGVEIVSSKVDTAMKYICDNLAEFEYKLQETKREARYASNKTEERIKDFLGIANYFKTPENKVLFTETSLLGDILNQIKQLHYQVKKLQKE